MKYLTVGEKQPRANGAFIKVERLVVLYNNPTSVSQSCAFFSYSHIQWKSRFEEIEIEQAKTTIRKTNQFDY